MVIWLFFSPFPRKIKRQKVLSRNFKCTSFIFIRYVPVYQFVYFVYMFNNLTYTLKPRWNLDVKQYIAMNHVSSNLFISLSMLIPFPLILADKRVSSILEILFFIISFQRENHWFRISERVSCMCSTYRKLRKVRVRAWKRVGKSKGRGRTRITLFARCLSTSKGTFISTRVARHFLAFNGYPPVA